MQWKQQKKNCDVYGDDAINVRTVQKWFTRFWDGNFSLKDEKHSGRPTEIDDDQILALIQNNPRFTSREIAKILKISKSAVLLHLEKSGMVNRYDVWVPHNLSDKNLMDRVFACTLLLNRNDNDPFLKRLVTGDEKWIVYNNAKRKRHWSRPGNASLSTPKVGLHSKKVMLSVWWDYKGIIYYELIPDN